MYTLEITPRKQARLAVLADAVRRHDAALSAVMSLIQCAHDGDMYTLAAVRAAIDACDACCDPGYGYHVQDIIGTAHLYTLSDIVTQDIPMSARDRDGIVALCGYRGARRDRARDALRHVDGIPGYAILSRVTRRVLYDGDVVWGYNGAQDCAAEMRAFRDILAR